MKNSFRKLNLQTWDLHLKPIFFKSIYQVLEKSFSYIYIYICIKYIPIIYLAFVCNNFDLKWLTLEIFEVQTCKVDFGKNAQTLTPKAYYAATSSLSESFYVMTNTE